MNKRIALFLFLSVANFFLIVGPLFAAAEQNFNKLSSDVIDTTRGLRPRWHRSSVTLLDTSGHTEFHSAVPAVVYKKFDSTTGCDQIFFRNLSEPDGDEIQVTFSCEPGRMNKTDVSWGPYVQATAIDTDDDGHVNNETVTGWSIFYSAELEANTSSSDPSVTCKGTSNGCRLFVAFLGTDLSQTGVKDYVDAHQKIEPIKYEVRITNPTTVSPNPTMYDRSPEANFPLWPEIRGQYVVFVRHNDLNMAGATHDMIYTLEASSGFGYLDVTLNNLTYRYSGNCSSSTNGYDFNWPQWSMDGKNVVFSVKGETLEGTGHYQIGTVYYMENGDSSFNHTTYYACAEKTYSTDATAEPASSLEIWTPDVASDPNPSADRELPHFSPFNFSSNQPGIIYDRKWVDAGNTDYALAGFTVYQQPASSPPADFDNQITKWYGSEKIFDTFANPHDDSPTSRRRPVWASPSTLTTSSFYNNQWIAYERLDSNGYWQIFGMDVSLPPSLVIKNPFEPSSGFDDIIASAPITSSASSYSLKPLQIGSWRLTGPKGVSYDFFTQRSKLPNLSTQSLIDQIEKKALAKKDGYRSLKVNVSFDVDKKVLGKATFYYSGTNVSKLKKRFVVVKLDKTAAESLGKLKISPSDERGLYSGSDGSLLFLAATDEAYKEYQWTYCPHHHLLPEFNNAGWGTNHDGPVALAYGMIYEPTSSWDPAHADTIITGTDNRIMYLHDLGANDIDPSTTTCAMTTEGCDKAGNTVYHSSGDPDDYTTNDNDGDGMPNACDACPDDASNASSSYGYLYDSDGDSIFDTCTPPSSNTTCESMGYTTWHSSGSYSDISHNSDADEGELLYPDPCDTCPEEAAYNTDFPYYDYAGNGYCEKDIEEGCDCCCCCEGGDCGGDIFITIYESEPCFDLGEEDLNGNGVDDQCEVVTYVTPPVVPPDVVVEEDACAGLAECSKFTGSGCKCSLTQKSEVSLAVLRNAVALMFLFAIPYLFLYRKRLALKK